MQDLGKYLKKKNKEVYQHIEKDEVATVEACFSSQIITLFIYDNDREKVFRIFELFLLEGEQVLIDLIASMLNLKKSKIVTLSDLDLMNYLRKDMVHECFNENSLQELLREKNIVNLTFSS